jgi:hypothetical protein
MHRTMQAQRPVLMGTQKMSRRGRRSPRSGSMAPDELIGSQSVGLPEAASTGFDSDLRRLVGSCSEGGFTSPFRINQPKKLPEHPAPIDTNHTTPLLKGVVVW